MSNEMMTINSNDGWDDAAEQDEGRVIQGSLLKFGTDGRWISGQDGRELKEGTKLVAFDTVPAWVKWQGGKPVEHQVCRGEKLPRTELGDLEESGWENGPDGKPRDPWQYTKYVYLEDPVTAEAFTFSTSSMSGLGAISDLVNQVKRKRFSGRRVVPVIELGKGMMQTKFGKKPKPVLKIVNWIGDNRVPAPAIAQPKQIEHKQFASGLAEDGYRAEQAAKRQFDERNPPPTKAPARGDMENDDIPF